MRPEIPSSLLDDVVRNGVDTRSNPPPIRENNALHDADGNAMATVAAEHTTTSDRALLGLGGVQLNKDFAHQCFGEVVRMLGAQLFRPVEGVIGPRMVRIPGIPNRRFLPHQVWGIRVIVDRILADCPPVALIADDMRLGKTHCALATLPFLK